MPWRKRKKQYRLIPLFNYKNPRFSNESEDFFAKKTFILNCFIKKFPLPLLAFCFLATLITWLVREHFFFWDTVQLASKHAHYFYENGFSSLFLPDEIDSGHPPIFGFLLAGLWVIFGKTLFISHFYALFFLLILIFQSYHLGNFLFKKNGGIWFCSFLLASPVMASQAILVSPDVALCAFFIMGLNGIFQKKNTLLAIASLGLAMTSMRGMIVIIVLFLTFLQQNQDFLRENYKNIFILNKKIIFPFLPAALFGVCFLTWHFVTKGWIGYFSGSTWAASFQAVGFKDFLKNIVIVVWRLADFGHIFIWLTALYYYFSKKLAIQTTRFLALFLFSILLLTPSALLYTGLSGHRYFLPIYIISFLIVLDLVKNNYVKIALILALLFGNFWVYPQPMATGWDSTLAHLPYYNLRKEMLHLIAESHLDIATIGTAFPNCNSFENVDLNNNNQSFAKKDFIQNKYIFYSNVMNDFSAEELQTLQNTWKKRFFLQKGQVKVILYEK